MEGSGARARSGSVQIIADPDQDPGDSKTYGRIRKTVGLNKLFFFLLFSL
jgi:hypothetical protein